MPTAWPQVGSGDEHTSDIGPFRPNPGTFAGNTEEENPFFHWGCYTESI